MPAWSKLMRKHKPNTLTGCLRLFDQVVRPSQAKDAQEVQAAFASWRLSDAGRVARVTSILPKWTLE